MLKKILFLKHIAIEGPGSLEAFFWRSGFPIEILDLESGGRIPDSVDSVAAVVSLGGPMNVYQEEQYPFLEKEDLFIKKILKARIPFLGICLGSQILAKAAGARVVKSPASEIGFFDISLTESGKKDTIFKNITSCFKVFQWHEDMFEMAPNALWLSQSETCPHQAFRLGERAYGLQFHIEVDRVMIMAWMKEYWRLSNVLDNEKARNILSQYDQAKSQLDHVAEQIYNNFAAIIKIA